MGAHGRTGKETAAAELAKRGDLKSRRPPGLADLDSPERFKKPLMRRSWSERSGQ